MCSETYVIKYIKNMYSAANFLLCRYIYIYIYMYITYVMKYMKNIDSATNFHSVYICVYTVRSVSTLTLNICIHDVKNMSRLKWYTCMYAYIHVCKQNMNVSSECIASWNCDMWSRYECCELLYPIALTMSWQSASIYCECIATLTRMHCNIDSKDMNVSSYRNTLSSLGL